MSPLCKDIIIIIVYFIISDITADQHLADSKLEIGSDFCSWVTLFMAYLFVLMPHMKTTAKPLPPKSSQECNM